MNMMLIFVSMCVFFAIIAACQAVRNDREQRERSEREELRRLFHR